LDGPGFPTTIKTVSHRDSGRRMRMPDGYVVFDNDFARSAAGLAVPPVGRTRVIVMPDNDFVATPIAIMVEPRANTQTNAEGDEESEAGWALHIDHIRLVKGQINHLGISGNNFDDSIFV